jgi:hypothetical protein
VEVNADFRRKPGMEKTILAVSLYILVSYILLTPRALIRATPDEGVIPSDQGGQIHGFPTDALNENKSFPEDVIVFSAHQDWLSRIYLLRMNGSVIAYFEYSFYYFADLEVVDNEVYAAEAFAPRSYKVDLQAGNLDLVIDDWSLYYFYDLAFDGTYFYVTEWDLNRYDINGNKDGMASFDQSVHGSAWDGSYYWTLTEENTIKCWDISAWPTLIEVPENNFKPPTSSCRGLWFDGEYFWSAESIDGILGHIFQFNYRGMVINQWLEPAYRGWSACLVKASDYPKIPHVPSGPTLGEVGIEYLFSTSTTDPEEDSIFYLFDWGDGTDTDWLGPYSSGDNCSTFNIWSSPSQYHVKAKAKDVHGYESDWSDSLLVTIFARGDCNGSGVVEAGDVVYLINYLFQGGSSPEPMEAGDANCDSLVEPSDVVYLINYLFRGGPPPGCSKA